MIAEGMHGVKRFKPQGDKIMRMNSQTDAIENGFVHIPTHAHWLEAYLHELMMFPKGRYDDQVDSTSQALTWLRQTNSHDVWMAVAEMNFQERHGFPLPRVSVRNINPDVRSVPINRAVDQRPDRSFLLNEEEWSSLNPADGWIRAN
ncbi:hypothetical protein BH11PSE2_BH11PSE2_17140 [soil metagenome]